MSQIEEREPFNLFPNKALICDICRLALRFPRRNNFDFIAQKLDMENVQEAVVSDTATYARN